MARIQDIDIPYLEFGEAAAPGTPAAAVSRLYVKADGLFYSKDDAGVETLVSGGAGGGSVATDVIWDAAGDLVVGTGANTAAKLVIGAAGGAVSRVNGAVAWNSGTAFPTAATGDRYWRTDRGLEYYYDGTRWLTTTLYREPIGFHLTNITTSATVGRWTPWAATYDMWLDALYTTTDPLTTNDGSNYWNLALIKYQSDFATSATIVTKTTAADTVNVAVAVRTAIGALFVPATYVVLQLEVTKTGAPGTIVFPGAAISYRLVG